MRELLHRLSRGTAAGSAPISAVRAWWHTLLLFALGASWGLQFTLLKIANGSSLGEIGILTLCMVLLAAAYLITLALRRDWFRPTRRHLRFFATSGFLAYVVPLGGVLLLADHLSAGLIVLYSEALLPVFTVMIAVALNTERLTNRRLSAAACALIGVAVALWPELGNSTGAIWEVLLIVSVIPLAGAIEGVYITARWPAELRTLQVVTGEAVAGAAMLLPFYLIFEGTGRWPVSMGPGEWAILAFVPVTYIEVYLYFYLLRAAGAVFVSFACFVSLFAGFFWGMTLLGEEPRPSVWIAVGLVTLALCLITNRDDAAEPCRVQAGP